MLNWSYTTPRGTNTAFPVQMVFQGSKYILQIWTWSVPWCCDTEQRKGSQPNSTEQAAGKASVFAFAGASPALRELQMDWLCRHRASEPCRPRFQQPPLPAEPGFTVPLSRRSVGGAWHGWRGAPRPSPAPRWRPRRERPPRARPQRRGPRTAWASACTAWPQLPLPSGHQVGWQLLPPLHLPCTVQRAPVLLLLLLSLKATFRNKCCKTVNECTSCFDLPSKKWFSIYSIYSCFPGVSKLVAFTRWVTKAWRSL